MEVSGGPPQERDDAPAPETPDAPSPAAADTPPSPAVEDGQSAPPSETPPAPPITWSGLSQEDRNRLLSEADPEELRRHERVSGLAGQMAQAQTRRRVAELSYEDLPDAVRNRLLEESQKRAVEQAEERRLAQLGEQGEFYTLGEEQWRRFQEQAKERTERAALSKVESTFYQQSQGEIQQWAKENFPIEVLDKVRDEETDRLAAIPDFKGQYNHWLTALFKANAEHAKEQAVKAARGEWEREDGPARALRANAERAGSERTPETEGGSPRGSREITDEMIAAMELKDFEAVWDMERNRPKEGYTYKPTRAIDPRRMQVAGDSR